MFIVIYAGCDHPTTRVWSERRRRGRRGGGRRRYLILISFFKFFVEADFIGDEMEEIEEYGDEIQAEVSSVLRNVIID